MTKQNPRTSSLKLASFNIRSIPKKPPAPSLTFRRSSRQVQVRGSVKGKQ
jgi:hypothetical protein